MPFLDPKGHENEDDALPGTSGLHLDLDQKLCPSCHREALPWQDVCPDCDTPLVSRKSMPAESFPLPSHLLDGEDPEID